MYLITYSVVVNENHNGVQDITSIAVYECDKSEIVSQFIEYTIEYGIYEIRSFLSSLFWADFFVIEELEHLRGLYDDMDLSDEIDAKGFYCESFNQFIEDNKQDIIKILNTYNKMNVPWFKIEKLKSINCSGKFTKACK